MWRLNRNYLYIWKLFLLLCNTCKNKHDQMFQDCMKKESISLIFHSQQHVVWLNSNKYQQKWFSCNFKSLTDYLSVLWFSWTPICDSALCFPLCCQDLKREAASSSCPKSPPCVTLNHNDWPIDFPLTNQCILIHPSLADVVLRNCSAQNWNSVIICSAWCGLNLCWSLYTHQTYSRQKMMNGLKGAY